VKRLHVRIRVQANQDIKEIFDWIVSESGHPQTAEKFVDRIYDACEALGEFPLKGRARDDLKQGVRTLPFERTAVITYRVLSDEVEVLNIFYGGCDWETIVADVSGENSEG
jgi:toxin ParE1/3/4